MNVSGFNDHDNDVDSDNRSLGRRGDDDCNQPIGAPYNVAFYAALAVGVPGNVLSAIVWLRHGVTRGSSSAVYLAALAVNDLVYWLSTFIYISHVVSYEEHFWLDLSARYLAVSAATLEPLLVLGFSLERLFAICRPLQVRKFQLRIVCLISPYCMQFHQLYERV